jgi:hypothetical protein
VTEKIIDLQGRNLRKKSRRRERRRTRNKRKEIKSIEERSEGKKNKAWSSSPFFFFKVTR